MVKNTNAKRKQHYSDTKTSPKKKQSPSHDKGRYPVSEMEKRLLDTTTAVLRDCMDRRKERSLRRLAPAFRLLHPRLLLRLQLMQQLGRLQLMLIMSNKNEVLLLFQKLPMSYLWPWQLCIKTILFL